MRVHIKEMNPDVKELNVVDWDNIIKVKRGMELDILAFKSLIVLGR